MEQKIEMRKMRDFSAKINATFEFLRQNFKPLVKAIIYIAGPAILAQSVVYGYYNRSVVNLTSTGRQAPDGFASFLGEFSLWLGLTILLGGIAYVMLVAVVGEYVRIYDTKPFPSRIEVNEVWNGVKGYLFSLTGALIVSAVVIMVGIVLLILPGVYVMIVLSLMAPVLIMERKSLGESFTRSFALITDKWWSTFGLLFVTGLISVFMGYMFVIPQVIFTFLITFNSVSENPTALPLWYEVGLIFSSMLYMMGATFLRAIPVLAIMFQYFNLVERKEAAGLMAKLDTFGQTPQPNSAADAHESY